MLINVTHVTHAGPAAANDPTKFSKIYLPDATTNLVSIEKFSTFYSGATGRRSLFGARPAVHATSDSVNVEEDTEIGSRDVLLGGLMESKAGRAGGRSLLQSNNWGGYFNVFIRGDISGYAAGFKVSNIGLLVTGAAQNDPKKGKTIATPVSLTIK